MDKNQPFDPLGSPQVTTAAQTPAEVAESTGEADSSVNKRPAHMTDNDPQNFHYKWCIPGKPRKPTIFLGNESGWF